MSTKIITSYPRPIQCIHIDQNKYVISFKEIGICFINFNKTTKISRTCLGCSNFTLIKIKSGIYNWAIIDFFNSRVQVFSNHSLAYKSINFKGLGNYIGHVPDTDIIFFQNIEKEVYKIRIEVKSYKIVFKKICLGISSYVIKEIFYLGGKYAFRKEGYQGINIWDLNLKNEKKWLKPGREGNYCTRNGTNCIALNSFIIVNDKENYQVKVYNSSLKFLKKIGGKGFSNLRLDYCTHISIQKDKLLLVDSNNDRVCLWDYKQTKACLSTICYRRNKLTKLCRPSSIDMASQFILICNRSSKSLILYNSKFKIKTVVSLRSSIKNSEIPTSAKIIKNTNLIWLVLKSYNDSVSRIVVYDISKNEIVKTCSTIFCDIQGMTKIGDRVTVTDTRKKHIYIIDYNLDVKYQYDLTLPTGNQKFYCRIPSYSYPKISAVDYESGEILFFDRKLKLVGKDIVPKFVRKFCIVRQIISANHGIYMTGSGEKPFWHLNCQNKNTESSLSMKLKTLDINSITECYLNNNKSCIMLVEKEKDRLICIKNNDIKIVT